MGDPQMPLSFALVVYGGGKTVKVRSR